jgi:ABC-type lipoprotein export system ATPase subunit
MILRWLKLHNYKQFAGDHKFQFGSLNFISGTNGIGKSGLAREAPELLVYGYTNGQKLADLSSRGVAKSGWLEGNIEVGKDAFIIKRTFPVTKLTVTKNGEEIGKEWNLSAKEKFLKETFKDISYFKQFRIVDAQDKEANFLEQGEKVIKKILLSLTASKINAIRENCLTIKRERERYNKDTAVIYKNYPSKKRLDILNAGYEKIVKKEEVLDEKINRINNLHSEKFSRLNEIKGQLALNRKHLANAEKYPNCYVCKQELPIETRNKTIADKKAEIQRLLDEGNSLVPDIKKYRKLQKQGEEISEEYSIHKNKINGLIMRLEGRLQQSEFKYSTKDVEIAKQSIKHLDLFTSKYLVNRISTLEPIINSVLSKISYKINFDVNEKGKFAMTLMDSKGNDWKHTQLSSGQLLLLQIAIKLALLVEQGEEGILVADEGLGSLDSANLLHVIELVKSLPFQLIMILHHFNNVPKGINIIDLNEYFRGKAKDA